MSRANLPDVGNKENPIPFVKRGSLVGYRENGFWYLKNPEIKSGFFSGWIRQTDPYSAVEFDNEYLERSKNEPDTQ